jgi:hypothetical protein
LESCPTGDSKARRCYRFPPMFRDYGQRIGQSICPKMCASDSGSCVSVAISGLRRILSPKRRIRANPLRSQSCMHGQVPRFDFIRHTEAHGCSSYCSSIRCRHDFKNRFATRAGRLFVPAPLFPKPRKACLGDCRKSRRPRRSRFGLISHDRATAAIEPPTFNCRSAANRKVFMNFRRDTDDSHSHSINFEPELFLPKMGQAFRAMVRFSRFMVGQSLHYPTNEKSCLSSSDTG